MRSSFPPLGSVPVLRFPYTTLAALVALAWFVPGAILAESPPARPEPTVSRLAIRAESVLPHLQAARADLAWAATAQWTDSRGQPLTPEVRRSEAVRTAIRLRDTASLRHAAAFAAEIDRNLAAAESTLSQALSKGNEAAEELARILDLRAAIAAGFFMDTARSRELRARSAELAPRRWSKRPPPAESEARGAQGASTSGGAR